MAALRFVAIFSSNAPSGSLPVEWPLCESVSNQLSTTHKLWLTRVVLQTLWRCQRVQKSIRDSWIQEMELFFKNLMTDDSRSVGILRTNCFLIATLSLGHQVNFHDLYAPDNLCIFPHSLHLICLSSVSETLRTVVRLFGQRLQVSTKEKNIHANPLLRMLPAVTHLDPFEAADDKEMGFSWVSEILNSGYPEEEQYSMSSVIVRLLWRYHGLRPHSPDCQGAIFHFSNFD